MMAVALAELSLQSRLRREQVLHGRMLSHRNFCALHLWQAWRTLESILRLGGEDTISPQILNGGCHRLIVRFAEAAPFSALIVLPGAHRAFITGLSRRGCVKQHFE